MTDTEKSKIIKEPRVNISITGDYAIAIKQIRNLMEKRLNDRFSIAQVVKHMADLALAYETNNNNK